MLSKWKCASTLRSARGFSSSSSENSSSSSCWLSEAVAIEENRRTAMRKRRTAAMAMEVAVVGCWLPGYRPEICHCSHTHPLNRSECELDQCERS